MSPSVLRAPFLRWLPLAGAIAGAIGGIVIIAAMSAEATDHMGRLAGWETTPDLIVRMASAAVIVGSVCWALLYLVWGQGGPLEATRPRRAHVRRITVNRPAPAPWPIVPADVVARPPRERSLPVDLNQPLSAFDPQSIPTVSFESIRRRGLRPTA